MLYIATLISDGTINCRFGYADDLAIIRIGKNACEAVKAVQEEVEKIIQLASTQMINFDPSKSELLIFGGGTKKKLDTSNLTVRVGEQTITASPHIRSLGVWLDTTDI